MVESLMNGRSPACHPERKFYAKGMCKNCYRKTKPPSREAKDRHNKWFREIYYPANRAKHAESAKRWRRNNPEKERAYNQTAWRKDSVRRSRRNCYFRWKYGITLKQREEIMNANNGLCMICNQNVSTHLDHDHDTGEIRGALCQMCNRGLGHFKDNARLLRLALSYLKKSK